MLIVNDMEPNTVQKNLSPEHHLLQNKKRAVNEDKTGIDNSNIADKVAHISMDNGDQSEPQQPIWTRTKLYNSYVSWYDPHKWLLH